MLRTRLMTEELAEVVKAMQTGDYENLAKELADLLYVVYGTADEAGIPIDRVYAEVHNSNMTKTPAKDAGGKVQKGPDYEPPDIEAALTGRKFNG
jgi:predicted HAD superfamily Cof-like phosphohydrolase